MRRPTPFLVSTAVLALLLSGCQGEDVPGSPTVPTAGAVEPTQAPEQAEVPGSGAPKVENTLDTSKAEAAPCEALTEAQITSLLGADVNKDQRDETGPLCTWHSYGAQSAAVTVAFPKTTDLGLTAIYRKKGTDYRFFEEMQPVRGFPAVAWNNTDETTKGLCNVAAGTSDRSTVEATVRLSEKNVGSKDPCEAAHGVLDMVIGNIKGGGR